MKYSDKIIPIIMAAFITISANCLGQPGRDILTGRNVKLSIIDCNPDRPVPSDFSTKFRTIEGTATLLPQGFTRVLRSSFALLSDDRISNLSIKLTGRKNELANLTTCVLQVSDFNANFENLQTITGSEIRVFKVYLWRNYSQADLVERNKLCAERENILLSRTKLSIASQRALADFKMYDRMLNDPRAGSHGMHPKDLENKIEESLTLYFDNLSGSKNVNHNDIVEKMNEKAKRIVEIDNRYPLLTDTVYYREFVSPESFAPGDNINRLRFSTTEGNLTSNPLLLSVTQAPKVLTCIAQGGGCFLPILGCGTDLNETSDVSADLQVCQDLGRDSELIPPEVTQRGCNDMCCDACTNFLELLARSLVDRNLANNVRGINNDGNNFCNIGSSETAINNEIVVGWWKNTNEEWRCTPEIVFNDIISQFRKAGNSHLILVGQSLGGRMFTDMINNWIWGNGLELDLFVLWDATSFDGGISSVGNRPNFVLNFFQKDGLSNEHFQQGDHIAEADEEYDFSGCLSHNAIARSVFVHNRTEEAIEGVITTIRNNSRPGTD